MSTSIHSRSRRRNYSYGAGTDPTAASYRSARESLRSAREFKIMLDTLQHVRGHKRVKANLLAGYTEALKFAKYWRDHARHVRLQTKHRTTR